MYTTEGNNKLSHSKLLLNLFFLNMFEYLIQCTKIVNIEGVKHERFPVLSNHLLLLMIFVLSKIEDEKITSQTVGIGQNIN